MFLEKICIELILVLHIIPAHLFVCKFRLQNNRRECDDIWYSKFSWRLLTFFLMSKNPLFHMKL